MNDAEVKKLANAKKLSEVVVSEYDAILYVGGYGPAIDLAFDPVNGKLASDVSVFLRINESLRNLMILPYYCFGTRERSCRLFATDPLL